MERGTFSMSVVSWNTAFDPIGKDENYSTQGLIEEMSLKISSLPENSIIRIKLLHSKNINLINSKFLEQVIPKTMNYQIAGTNFSNKKK